MSWHFSQALVEEYSAGSCSDGAAFVRSKLTRMQQACSRKGKTTAAFRLSQFGTTLPRSMENLGGAVLTWFREASRARTYPQPEREPGSTASAAGSGPTWRESLVRFDRDSRGWKTHHCFFPEDLEWSSVTFPRWGMMRDGELWERITQALPTNGIGYGSWQTPTVQDANGRDRHNQRDGTTSPSLLGQARMWPTPCTNGLDGGSNSRNAAESRGAMIGGNLNPNWVEWLMGWPIGWTDLKPLETDKFQQWCDSHGKR
jgi:hypothetical protein